MSKNFYSTFSRRPYQLTPSAEAAAVDFNDPEAVADCLLESSPDIEVYGQFDQYDAVYLHELALESAHELITRRDSLRAERLAAVAETAVTHAVEPPTEPIHTTYVVIKTPLPAAS